MVSFITVAVGEKYGPEYPNAVLRMVEKHYKGEFDFYCVTDHDTGFHPRIKTLTPLSSYNVKGWWSKLYLFTPLMPRGRLVYIDLDVVILKDITDIVDGYKGKFCGDEDHIHFGDLDFGKGNAAAKLPPIDCSLGTAFVMMESGHASHIWRHFIENKTFVEKTFERHGDQVYISWMLGGQFDLLEKLRPHDHGFCSYKFNVVGKNQPARLRDKRVLPHTEWRMVNFHGHPKPFELIDTVPWVRDALT